MISFDSLSLEFVLSTELWELYDPKSKGPSFSGSELTKAICAGFKKIVQTLGLLIYLLTFLIRVPARPPKTASGGNKRS